MFLITVARKRLVLSLSWLSTVFIHSSKYQRLSQFKICIGTTIFILRNGLWVSSSSSLVFWSCKTLDLEVNRTLGVVQNFLHLPMGVDGVWEGMRW